MTDTDPDADIERIAAVCAEKHAVELVDVLTDAVSGAPHWRSRAVDLLHRIDTKSYPSLASAHEKESY